mgnify:CR=1 FL=1
MQAIDILIETHGRSRGVCHRVLQGLDAEGANWRPDGGHNSITWLVWHIAREQDAQIAHMSGAEQVWLASGWADRFALDLPRESMGYGHTAAEAGRVVVSDLSLLTGYLDAAADATAAYLHGLDPDCLDEVVDTRWDPPVTRGVRLVSIIDDASQHAGQAAYVRGLQGL